ncbi:hypothetical protein H9W95_07740 [Flavobacterium lindanitolerans]|nr:hypothetical protein [Flavobacterium lindanitolerans]
MSLQLYLPKENRLYFTNKTEPEPYSITDVIKPTTKTSHPKLLKTQLLLQATTVTN